MPVVRETLLTGRRRHGTRCFHRAVNNPSDELEYSGIFRRDDSQFRLDLGGHHYCGP